MKYWVLTFALISCSLAQALESSFAYAVQPVVIDYNEDSYIDVPDSVISQPSTRSTQLVEWFVSGETLSMTTTAKHTLFSGGDVESDVVLKEWVYSNSYADWDFSLGKKISSWGVGLAYRPLDVVQREDLLSSDQETLKGVNQFALEKYSDNTSIGFYLINPGESKNETGAEQPALIARYTSTGEYADWQALVRYSEQQTTQAGTGVSYIVTDALELHASALYSPRYHRLQHKLAGQSARVLSRDYPWQSVEYKNGINWLVGGNYSWAQRHNIIFEYWHDSRALNKTQWQNQITLARDQQALLETNAMQEAVAGNVAWSAEAFRQQPLIQNNLFLRYQYQGDNIIPRASVLYSPADSSAMLSAQIMLDRYSIKYNAGVRYYTGDTDSVFGQLPQSSQFYFTIYGNF